MAEAGGSGMEGGQNLSNKLWLGLFVVVCVTSEKKGRDAVGHNFKESVSQPCHTKPWECSPLPVK